MINNGAGIKGEHTFTFYDKFGEILREQYFENIVVTVGRGVAGEILAGIIPQTDGINYCGLGTGTTAPTNADTSLEIEGARKIRGSAQSQDNSFILNFYYNPTQGNGTWTEFGTFIDGDEAVDSGTLFTRALINVTKQSGEGLTITSQYNIL